MKNTHENISSNRVCRALFLSHLFVSSLTPLSTHFRSHHTGNCSGHWSSKYRMFRTIFRIAMSETNVGVEITGVAIFNVRGFIQSLIQSYRSLSLASEEPNLLEKKTFHKIMVPLEIRFFQCISP